MSGHGAFIQATSKILTVIFGKLFIIHHLTKGLNSAGYIYSLAHKLVGFFQN